MSPLLLQSIEAIIGLIESWPREILWYLFSVPPSADRIRIVSTFFYGNGVPSELSYRLYEACSGTNVKQEVCFWYKWFRTLLFGYGIHLGTYHNLHILKYLYVNGPKLWQYEPVIPKPPGQSLFGFKSILCPETDVIQHHVRHIRVSCEAPFCKNEICCKCVCKYCMGS